MVTSALEANSSWRPMETLSRIGNDSAFLARRLLQEFSRLDQPRRPGSSRLDVDLSANKNLE